MSEVKSTAEACYDARMALIKERDELARQVSELQLSQQNIINALGIKGEGAHSKLVIEYVHGLVAENVALKNSSAFVMQDGEPPQKFYRNEWFIAKVKGHGFAVLKALPEDYSYDYTTLDATYFRKDLILGWMQLPSTEYLPNVETPATDAFTAELRAQGVDEYAQAFREDTNMDFACNRGFYHGALDFAANLRAGRKG